jgi:membrane-bound serine protease (ClpP class)
MNLKNVLMLILIGLLLGAVGLAMPCRAGAVQEDSQDSRQLVYRLDVDGTINPAVADYLIQGIKAAIEARAQCVVITMDTPGGVLTTTKLIIKEMMNAQILVVVYVAPSGSSASSAGALITMGADIAAMAPGTNIGAAHPVGTGGEEIKGTMAEKVVNDLTAYMRSVVARKGRNADWAAKSITDSVSITAEEALKINVINVLANSFPNLLKQIDGKKITKDGHTYVLHTAAAKVVRVPHGLRFKVLDVIANPNVVYILGMLGLVGIMMELYHPGLIFPGALGGLCLLLALFASQVLPINYVGVLLIIFSVVLFILELKVPSFGLLTMGAIVSLTLGSLMLFQTSESAMRVSWSVIIPTVATVSAFFVFAMGLAVKAYRSKPRTGDQGLVGEVGYAMSDVDTQGKVAVHGELWNARSDSHIPKGERVRVIRVDNLWIKVTRDIGS